LPFQPPWLDRPPLGRVDRAPSARMIQALLVDLTVRCDDVT
jgi:hypothetical protein